MTILDEQKLVCNRLKSEFQRLLKRLDELKAEEQRVDEVERDVMSLLLKMGRAAIMDFIEASGDGDVGEKLTCNGETLQRMPEQHTRNYRSIFGLIVIRRCVYAKRKNQKLVSPLDKKLGLPEDETSYLLENWMGALATYVPYDIAAEWLHNVFGVGGSSTTIENRVIKLAEHAESFRVEADQQLEGTEAEVLVALADAKGVPIRTPWEFILERELGRKKHLRRRKNSYERSLRRRRRGDQVKSQQATVGACFSVTPISRTAQQVLRENDEGKPDNFKHQNKLLWAEMSRIEDDQESRGAVRVFQQMAAHLAHRDPTSTRTLVCIMDGAPSLWKLQREYLPRAIPIIDIFHVNEKLWAVAHCFEPDCSKAAEERVTKYLRMLLEGKVDCLRGLFQRFLNQGNWSGSKQEALEEAISYLRKNRHAMQYHEYIEKGYPIGSGAIEGACKHVIGDRLCRSGMRWEQEGAEDILHLRTIHLNANWEAFVQHRIQNEQIALYDGFTAT